MDEFLKKLNRKKLRNLFIKLTALNSKNQPLEQIEGKVTTGNINKDGKSSLQRSCTLTMVTDNLDFRDYLWGLKTRVKIEVGIENDIDPNFPEIYWTNQGVYILNDFKPQKNINSYTINISGQDKMCLLNGTVGGTIPQDMRLDSYIDENGNSVKVPLNTLIGELVHVYGQEDYSNIMIEKIDVGFEALANGLSEEITVYFDNGKPIGFEKSNEETEPPADFKAIVYDPGEQMGYSNLQIFFPEELTAKAGESVTSILDKIVQVFGQYRYYYNIKGQFIFEKKPEYLVSSFDLDQLTNQGLSFESRKQTSLVRHDYGDNELTISLNSNPNLGNVKNDFTIQGKKDDKISIIRLRYAIDKKPTSYIPIYQDPDNRKGYSIKDEEGIEKYDWREIIYQMALDYQKYNQELDFYNAVETENPQYFAGVTGYEQYYTDILSFWRELYYPAGEPEEQLPIGVESSEYNSKGWRTKFLNDPTLIPFWFDFIDNNSSIQEKSVSNIGSKAVVKTDDKIRVVYQPSLSEAIWTTEPGSVEANGKAVYEVHDFSQYVCYGELEVLLTQLVGKPIGTIAAVYSENYNKSNDKTGGKEYMLIWDNEDYKKAFGANGTIWKKVERQKYKCIGRYLNNSIFEITSIPKAAQDTLTDLINKHCHFSETINLSGIPNFLIEPNETMVISQNDLKIAGEYIIDKISLSLSYNGTMNITATKVPEQLY